MHAPPTFIHIHSGLSTFQYILVALHITAHSAPPIFHYILKLPTFLHIRAHAVTFCDCTFDYIRRQSHFCDCTFDYIRRRACMEALKKNKDLKAAVVNPVAEIFKVPDSVKKKEDKIDYIFKLPCFNKE